ncbi:kinetoplast-associated protein-like protein [Leishmania infantum JPCM5]|uniref:Kinetoplast-associated_protein-like_protein n=2 Tax=Leishmania infantum TaxID=5671 RepID=A0A6L0XL31_LEIIN|nr:kinetoplast-associated protein-like protein [Leishmania infantum JPCM5]CAC9521305.1 kinetoplast-associated_protein-like_protein [Leishmania infantum]CAM70662.1 kinetoplast-associated protein-like protein [Leishmania infantum JPCM5]SUZ44514.1 kinetoplast-associated_protein-like_protein [Leishmania infantum]|eukprot:XP_001467600.1 kinetoplast-associated protein-like protein [Leishmania infantum JPCM5]
MAPRRSRAKRLHLPAVARCLAAQPSAAPHATVASPVAPPPAATAPAAKPPRSVEPPVATCVQPAATSVEPAAIVARAPVVEETPAAPAPNSTYAATVLTRVRTAEVQCPPDVTPASVAATASAVPASEAMPLAAPVSAAPSAHSPRAAISAHRGRLRAKRRAAAALARKSKHHRNTISAPQQAITPSTSSQPPAPAAAPETVPVATVEAPAAEAAVEPTSDAAASNIAQAGSAASELEGPAAATVVSSPPAPAPISTPHRSAISRIPKKRKFFAELDDNVTLPAAEATPPPASSERHLQASDAAVDALSVTKVASAVPSVTLTAAVEEVTKKTSAVAGALHAPAAARRMVTRRTSKTHAKGAAAKLQHSSGSLVSAEATLEAAPAVIASVTRKASAFSAATLTMAEKPATPTAPAVAAPSVEPLQRSASSTPPSTAPHVTSAAAVAPLGRATISRLSKKRKHFFAELEEPPASDAAPSVQGTSTLPAAAHAAVTLKGIGAATTIAAAEPTAPTVEAVVAPTAAAVAVADVVETKATATRAMARRRSMKRGKLPPEAAVAEAPSAAEAISSEATAPTPATPTVEATSASVPEAVQGAEVAAPAESIGEAATTADAARPVEGPTPPAAQRKLRTAKKKVKRLTAAAIRRRELAAYNRIPKRFRPPEVPRSVWSTPVAAPQSTPAPTDVPAAVSATQTKSMEATGVMHAEGQTPAVVEAIVEAPAVELAQPPPRASTASAAAAVEPEAPLTETTKSADLFAAPAEEQCLMGQARVATKSMKVRLAQSIRKRFFTSLEDVPAANPTEAAATETTAAAVEVQVAVPQTRAAMEAIEPSPQVAGDGTTVDAELTAAAEEAVAPKSTLNAESKAAPATSAVEEASTEAPQPMAAHPPTETNPAEEPSFKAVKPLCTGGVAPDSESVAVHTGAPALAQRKVVRVTNVRDLLKAIRKAKRAGKRGCSKERLSHRPLSQHLVTAVTGAVDEVVNAEASSTAAEANLPAEVSGAGIHAPLHKEAEAATAVEETEAPSATEQQTVVQAQAAEVEVEMCVESTTTMAAPEVTEVRLTEPVDKEAVQPPEALQHAEMLVAPAQAAVAAPVKDFLPRAFSSPSPARRQAAKQKIKKHAKLAAARLNKRQTYTVSATAPLAAEHAPAEAMDTPLVEAVHAAAEPPVPPAEEASAATLVRRSALVLPSGNVVVESFTDNEMVLRRTALDNSWDVGLRFDWQERTLAISSFPTFEETDKRSAHPFVHRFKSKPRWLLKEVNETNAAHMKKALDSMNRSLTARFVFRHLR